MKEVTPDSRIYVDTCVIISFVDEADPSHSRAVKLLSSLSGRRIVSWLTLTELASVLSRAGIEEPVAVALYAIKSVEAEIERVDFNDVLRLSVRYAQELKLRTLDLLHVVACKVAGCDTFATLDVGVARKADDIQRVLEIRVASLV